MAANALTIVPNSDPEDSDLDENTEDYDPPPLPSDIEMDTNEESNTQMINEQSEEPNSYGLEEKPIFQLFW